MTEPSPQRVLDAALRTNFVAFLMKVFEELHPGAKPLNPVWYLQAMCHFALRCVDGDVRRGVITVPPRHLKSITLSVALVAWLLGRDPTMKIMVANYSQDLSSLLAGQCRTVMESSWYKRLYPGTRIDPKNRALLHFFTTQGGSRKAVSVGGSITGFGADLIIVDDCMKAEDVFSQVERERIRRWYDHTLVSRLNDKDKGVIISIQQRLHEDDLTAYLLDKGFDHLNLPAIAVEDQWIAIGQNRFHHRRIDELLDPAREGRAALDQLRRELGPQAFSAQYQQDPVTPEGNLLNLDWFGNYGGPNTRDGYTKVLQSWDTATSSDPSADWSVCTTWGYEHPHWDLLDVYRRRVDFPDLQRAMIALIHHWKPDRVLVEDANSGRGLMQSLRFDGHKKVQLVIPRGDKTQRVINITGELEAGGYHLPEEAPWLAEFRKELRAFPSGKHDDQVDSLAQAVKYIKDHWRWAQQEHMPDGRPKRILRSGDRKKLRARSGSHA